MRLLRKMKLEKRRRKRRREGGGGGGGNNFGRKAGFYISALTRFTTVKVLSKT